MTLLDLIWKSLKNRKLTTTLTILSIALSVTLLIGTEHVRKSARESFQGVISDTDLIVGPRTGPLQLLLYTVFHMGSATANIDYETYQKFTSHPAVKWTVPISLGDSHRGYRVVATNADFYKLYRYRNLRTLEFTQGRAPEGVFDVILGSEVAEKLGYQLDDRVVVTHGITSAVGIMDHDDKPFKIVGVLARTATPIDRSLYVTLEGMEAVHIDWQSGAPPLPGTETSAEQLLRMKLQPEQITAFLLRTKTRIETLRLQREINAYRGEPLLAIIPGVTLSEFWRGVSYAENGLQIVTVFIVLTGLLGMLMSIYTSLNERRREMAILRALGAGPRKILMLLVFEASLLSLLGCILGVALTYGLLFVFQPLVETEFGIHIPIRMLAGMEAVYLMLVVLAGTLIGLVPAHKAYRNTLSDGLTIRV